LATLYELDYKKLFFVNLTIMQKFRNKLGKITY